LSSSATATASTASARGPSGSRFRATVFTFLSKRPPIHQREPSPELLPRLFPIWRAGERQGGVDQHGGQFHRRRRRLRPQLLHRKHGTQGCGGCGSLSGGCSIDAGARQRRVGHDWEGRRCLSPGGTLRPPLPPSPRMLRVWNAPPPRTARARAGASSTCGQTPATRRWSFRPWPRRSTRGHARNSPSCPAASASSPAAPSSSATAMGSSRFYGLLQHVFLFLLLVSLLIVLLFFFFLFFFFSFIVFLLFLARCIVSRRRFMQRSESHETVFPLRQRRGGYVLRTPLIPPPPP
jgi:hypothetical protein